MTSYFDTSALVKLIRREPESDALADWLAANGSASVTTSVLAEVELPRALLRVGPELLPRIPALIGRLDRIEVDDAVRAAAAAYPQPVLRSLDAIHLASAQSLGGKLAHFVTYDRRLRAIARDLGLPVATPGMATG